LATGSKVLLQNLQKAKLPMQELLRSSRDLRTNFEKAAKAFGGDGAGRGPGPGRGGGGGGGGGGGARGTLGAMAMGAGVGATVMKSLMETVSDLPAGIGVPIALGFTGLQAALSFAGMTERFMRPQMGASRITGLAPMKGRGQWEGSQMHSAVAAFATETGNMTTFKEEKDRQKDSISWLSRRATAVGMSPDEMAGFIGRATRLAGVEEQQTFQRAGRRVGAVGFEQEAGTVGAMQALSAEAGMTGPRQARYFRRVGQLWEQAVARGSSEGLSQVGGLYTRLARIGSRMEELAPSIISTAEGAFGRAGAGMGGSPQSNFLIRSMGAYLQQQGAENVSMIDILNALQGGPVEALGGKVLGPEARVMATAMGVRREFGGFGRGGQTLVMRQALDLQRMAPAISADIMEAFKKGNLTEDNLNSIMAKHASGVSGGKEGDARKPGAPLPGEAFAGELKGVHAGFQKLLDVAIAREDLLSSKEALATLTARAAAEVMLLNATTGAVKAVDKFAARMRKGATEMGTLTMKQAQKVAATPWRELAEERTGESHFARRRRGTRKQSGARQRIIDILEEQELLENAAKQKRAASARSGN
jgi:hypothetical protein